MATIKRNGDKVVLKDGKVACGCCELDCCMYSAQALADGLYGVDDLPDAVTITGVSYSRSGTEYGNTANGVIFEENVWAKYTNGSRSSRPCLIQGGVKDQFADTYTISYSYFANLDQSVFVQENVAVERESICVWIGLDSCGNQVTLVYRFEFNENLYKWVVLATRYSLPPGGGILCNNVNPISGTKNGFQNTPAGDYNFNDMVVS